MTAATKERYKALLLEYDALIRTPLPEALDDMLGVVEKRERLSEKMAKLVPGSSQLGKWSKDEQEAYEMQRELYMLRTYP